MDEIFLRDYANNVAMAQQPNGLAAIYQQPGFEGYVPSFSVVDQQPAMINQDLNLAPEQGPVMIPQPGPVMIPTLKELATNVAKDRIRNYALKKIGSEGLKSKVLGKALDFVIPGNQFVGLASLASGLMGGPEINPIGALQNINTKMQSSLFGRSKTMAEYLAARRAKKAAERDYKRDTQGEINTVPVNILNMQPTAEDIYRGGGPDRSPSTPSVSSARSARHTAGPGGLHSGY